MLALASGCGGLGKKAGDASHTDLSGADSTTSGPDTARLATDTLPPDAGATTSNDASASPGADGQVIPGAYDGGTGSEVAAPSPATIIVLPDTQYYTFVPSPDPLGVPYTKVFAMQTNWILAQKASLNIQAVLHVGDLVLIG